MEPPSSTGQESWSRFSAECTLVQAHEAIVYDLSGTLTDSRAAYEFLNDLRERIPGGTGPIVIDLTHVRHMTSCGVGILASCLTSASNANRPLRIAGMSKRVESVMQVVGLLRVIPRFASRVEAISATSS